MNSLVKHAPSYVYRAGTVQVMSWCKCGWQTRWCDTTALADELVAEHVRHAQTGCVTWLMRGVTSCLSTDHTITCGWGRSHAEEEGREYDCAGCAPSDTVAGARVCAPCWTRIEFAVAGWETWLQKLGGEARAVTPATLRRPALGPRLPWSTMQLDIDEATRHRASGENLSLARWLASDKGAEDAVRFASVATRIKYAYPVEELERDLPKSRCPKCKMRSLAFYPPDEAHHAAAVRCRKCHHSMDESTFERYAAIEEQCCRTCRPKTDDGERLGCADGQCRCHKDAPVPSWMRSSKPTGEERFDPTLPEHEHLDQLDLLTVPRLVHMAVELDVRRARSLRKAELIKKIREAQQDAS